MVRVDKGWLEEGKRWIESCEKVVRGWLLVRVIMCSNKEIDTANRKTLNCFKIMNQILQWSDIARHSAGYCASEAFQERGNRPGNDV